MSGDLTAAQLRMRVAELEDLNARLMESNRLYETIFNENGRVRLYSDAIIHRVKRARAALRPTPSSPELPREKL